MRPLAISFGFAFALGISIGSSVAGAAGDTTPLLQAVQASDLAAVTRLVRTGTDVKGASRYGVTPLSLAAAKGDAAIVKTLLDAGADPNSESAEGEPVLMTAARAGDLATVETLLARGARPNQRERWLSQTALMWAAAENHVEVVRALLDAGADPNATSDILDTWALSPAEPATPKVNTPKGGMAVLHYAARQGALDAVRVLVSAATLDINQTDPDGVSALLYATLNGHYDLAAFLLERGANPNVVDQYGRGVLYAAIDMHRLEPEPRPPAHTAATTTPLALARLALAKGANVDAPIAGRIPTRCANGCYSAGIEGATPLWRAARENGLEATELLLAAGADPSVPARDGSTPLMVAAGLGWREDHTLGTERESIAIVTALLANGIDVNDRNRAGETALHGAAGRGANDVVRFLVERGAQLDVKDRANRTPLDTAMGIAQIVRNGGGAPVNATPKVSTATLLRGLMTDKGVPIEPYRKPPAAE